MRVAINTLAHDGTGGGMTYFKNVLPRLANDNNEYIVVVPADRNLLSEPDASNVRFEFVDLPAGRLSVRLLYEQVVLPIRLLQWDADVLYSPADLTPLLAACPAVLAIRNPNPYVPPERHDDFVQRFKFLVQRYLTWLSARRATRVFFVSDYSKRTANEYLHLPGEKISTVYHGIDLTLFENPSPPDEAELERTVRTNKPYILCVSTLHEHKNYEVLLRGYGCLPVGLREEYSLLVAGRAPAKEYYHRLQRIVGAEGIEDDVTFLGEVEYEHIPWLYANATMYAFPSKLETFGHTLVEAMASRLPIVAADAACIPEIVGDAGLLFDPDDPAELAELMEAVLTDAGLREQLSTAAAERANRFSWNETVAKTRTLFEEAVEGI